MTKELEIEYKNLLTKEEYEQLLVLFNFTENDAFTQENHYFDTVDFRLKEMNSALRIREKNGHYECTLKTPAPEGKYEITDALNAEQAQGILSLSSFEALEVKAALEEREIDWKELKPIGTLTTHRIEVEYKQGLLVFDHSEYIGTEDFEVEYEVADAAAGEQFFMEFLKQQGIPLRKTKKKIARFMDAAKTRP